MFTKEQIEDANAKVKSGADFPKLAQDLIELGITKNDVYVSDGHAEYFGKDGYSVETKATYSPLEIAETSDAEQFRQRLKIHQQGQTDFPTFCRDSADAGVEKWTIDFDKMTCTYFDKKGQEMLFENIPTA